MINISSKFIEEISDKTIQKEKLKYMDSDFYYYLLGIFADSKRKTMTLRPYGLCVTDNPKSFQFSEVKTNKTFKFGEYTFLTFKNNCDVELWDGDWHEGGVILSRRADDATPESDALFLKELFNILSNEKRYPFSTISSKTIEEIRLYIKYLPWASNIIF